METIFFCARNVWDYFSHVEDAERLSLPAVDYFSLDVLKHPFIKKFFGSLSEVYARHNEALNASIAGDTGIDGLRLDFNFGLRLDVPEGNFRVRIGDADGGQIFFDEKFPACDLFPSKNISFVGASKFFTTTKKFLLTRSTWKINPCSSSSTRAAVSATSSRSCRT